jgi:broad specificity phosphatase PhoE
MNALTPSSVLAPVASAAAFASSTSPAAVSLFSIHSSHQSPTTKILHLIRHAEGTHNLNEEESKLPLHFDAKLTERGVAQCNQLAKRTRDLDVEAIVVSPLTRTLETSILSFPHLYKSNNDDARGDDGSASSINANSKKTAVPFVAYEEWRETVNFLCDCRSSLTQLKQLYPNVCFNNLAQHQDNDPIWAHYESIYGDHNAYRSKRESDDPISLYKRSHAAWKALLNRPEKKLALVGHQAFFMHNFTPLFEQMNGVVKYEDSSVQELMSSTFDNCELKSVKIDFNKGS